MQLSSSGEPAKKGDCKAAEELYVPYKYKGQCLNPPLSATLEGCPVDERHTLQNGTTVAIPYPAKNFNCNPYLIGG